MRRPRRAFVAFLLVLLCEVSGALGGSLHRGVVHAASGNASAAQAHKIAANASGARNATSAAAASRAVNATTAAPAAVANGTGKAPLRAAVSIAAAVPRLAAARAVAAPPRVEAAKTARLRASERRVAAAAGLKASLVPSAAMNFALGHEFSDTNLTDDPCSCEFKGTCSCEAAIEFMDCISAACASGNCDCHNMQFQHACGSLASECSSLEMMCTSERAACAVEEEAHLRGVNRTADAIHEELRELKDELCRLELAAEDGWLNAERRLRSLREEIEGKMEALRSKGAKLPEMHCEKHFEEWHYPEAPPRSAASSWRGATWQCSIVALTVASFLMSA